MRVLSFLWENRPARREDRKSEAAPSAAASKPHFDARFSIDSGKERETREEGKHPMIHPAREGPGRKHFHGAPEAELLLQGAGRRKIRMENPRIMPCW